MNRLTLKKFFFITALCTAASLVVACGDDSASSGSDAGISYSTRVDPNTGKTWTTQLHASESSDEITCNGYGCYFSRQAAEQSCPAGFRLPTVNEVYEYASFAIITMDGYIEGGNPMSFREHGKRTGFWAYDNKTVCYKSAECPSSSGSGCYVKTNACDGSRYTVVCVMGDAPS